MNEPWIERVIREAQEAGTFDDVPGLGQPIPDLGHPYEANWWARRWIDRERQRDATIEFAKKVEAELTGLLTGTVEHRIRTGLESLNIEIVEHNKRVPEVNGLPLLDVERFLGEWAHRRGG